MLLLRVWGLGFRLEGFSKPFFGVPRSSEQSAIFRKGGLLGHKLLGVHPRAITGSEVREQGLGCGCGVQA